MNKEILHKDITERILKAFFAVYGELGAGFLESVYRNAMAMALRDEGLAVTAEANIEVVFRAQVIGSFRADLLVDDKVIIELKAARAMDSAFEAQLLNYLRATRCEVGLLLNFGPKPQFKRLVYENSRKDPRSSAFVRG